MALPPPVPESTCLVTGASSGIGAEIARELAAPPPETLAAWSERDALRDRAVRWDGGEGTARGIAPSGALQVETATGTRELHAGEVALVRPGDEAARRAPGG